MTRTLLLTAITTLALNAPAMAEDSRGFSASDLNAAASTARVDPAMADARERVAQTETLRAAFVLQPAAGWALMSNAERQNLQAAFGPARPFGDDAIQWFMRGASVRTNGDDLSGLYNPLADVWLILKWQRIGGSQRIVAAEFLSGHWLRKDDAVDWTQGAGSYGEALAASTAAAWASFEGLPGDAFFTAMGLSQHNDSDEAFASILQWMGSLSPWAASTAHRKQWSALHTALTEGTAGETVSPLPPDIRASLLPMGVIGTGEGQSLLLMSPLAPELVIAADYGNATPKSFSGKSAPKLTLANLANARTHATAGGVQ